MTQAKPQDGTVRWDQYGKVIEGMTEYWYPVMASHQLKGKIVTKRLVGQDFILVRHDGRAYALEDKCAHRKFPLSNARCEFAGHITCSYHGWTYDVTNGVLKAALTDGPNSPLVGNVRLRSYPVEERCGMIFVWMGNGDRVPIEDDLPEEMLRADARIFTLFRHTKGNWRYACENGIDEGHNKMLHRTSRWVFFRRLPAWNETEMVRSDDGKWLARRQNSVHESDEYPGLGQWPRFNFWQRRSRTVMANNQHTVAIRLPCLLRVTQPGRANWTHYNWYIPVDRENYLDVGVAVAWASGFKRLTWWLRYWTYILLFHRYDFISQDLWAIAQMPDTPPVQAFRPDISITAWREMVENEERQPMRSSPDVGQAAE